jgi:hypothetical protein
MEPVITEKSIETKKIVASSISLGVAVLKEMIGDSISNSKQSDTDLESLMTIAILTELGI